MIALLLLLAAVEVRHDDKLAVTYSASQVGNHVVVRAAVEPGWHTFAMDNKVREREMLKGKPSLGSELPTVITLNGFEAAGAWTQTSPKDFSKPAERYYGFGYDKEAYFVVPVKAGGKGQVALKAQACTESVCKNIDVEIPVENGKGKLPQGLIPVKMQ